ncbi:MAG: MFS transporter [Holosporaceae bacterium]|jgi:MFS family permease|nr:MFS transporter [Holosporaceae bacterium]
MSGAPNNRSDRTLAFVIWYAALFLLFYQFIARSAFPTVLTEQFMKYFQIDAVGMGVLASCYYWVYTFMQVPAGIIIDKVGIKALTTIAATTCAIGVLVFIATSNCYIAGLGQMLLGFGSSFAFLLTLKVIATWFPSSEVPVKTAYTTAIGCSGPIIGGVMVSNLVKEFDWIVIMRVFALFGLLLAALLWMIVRERNVGQKDHGEMSIIRTLNTIVGSRQILVLSTLSMMQYAPLSALGDLWGVAFIKKAYGVDASTATLMNNMLYAGMVVGAPTFAYLAVFWNSYKKPMMLGVSIAAVSMSIVIFCTQLSLWSAFALFFLTGFSGGAALSFPLGIMMFPKSISATVSGFINMATMMSGVILMPLIGYIINRSWSGAIIDGVRVYSTDDYRAGLMTVVIFLIIGILLSLMVEDRSTKENRS